MSRLSDVFVTIAIAGLVLIVASCAFMVAFGVWCYLIAPAIGRVAAAIERRLRPVTERERQAIADERAARDSLRPYGSVDGVSTIYVPIGMNGHRETYEDDSVT